MLHHGPLHVLHGKALESGAPLPSPFPHLVHCAVSHSSACSAFLHFLKHVFTAAPRAQLMCSTSAWCGSMAELAVPCTGKPQQFLTDATLQPSASTKTLPCKPKNQMYQVWKCQTSGFFGFRGGLQILEESKMLSLMENFSGRISFQCWAST